MTTPAPTPPAAPVDGEPSRPDLTPEPCKPDVTTRLTGLCHTYRTHPLIHDTAVDAIAVIAGERDTARRRHGYTVQAQGERDEARDALRAIIECDARHDATGLQIAMAEARRVLAKKVAPVGSEPLPPATVSTELPT